MEADRLELIDDCLRWLELERDDPATRRLPLEACEARFGQRRAGEKRGALSVNEPIEIALLSGPLRLNGRIDRVNWDQARSEFRVVDYKSGKVRDDRSAQLQGGRMLQLPLYVLAAAKLLEMDPGTGGAAYVYPTRRGDFRTVEWKPEELAERHDELLMLLEAIIESARNGDFMIAPYADKACNFCDFKEICVGARGRYAEPKAGDGRLTRLATAIRSIP